MEQPIKQVKVTEIIKETENAKTFILEPMHGWHPDYKSGQFLTLLFDTPFGEKRRSYSISSSPEKGEPFSITVKKVENGEFSRRMLDQVKEGDVFATSGINGFFTLPENLETIDQVFFLAAGSGITPCYSILKTLLHGTDKKVVLIYSNKNERDTIFLKSIQELQEQYPAQFQVRFLNSQHAGIFNRRLSKWLLTILLKQYLKTEKSRVLFYLCGPFEYMQMIRITLLTEGFEADKIRKEQFVSLTLPDKPKPPDVEKHIVTIHFNGHHYILPVQYPKTILATAKEKNILLPYSCESGVCGACAATCTKGKVWMSYNGVLMEKEIDKGRVLTCQGFPVGGDVELVF